MPNLKASVVLGGFRALEQTELVEKLGANDKGSWCPRQVLEFGSVVLGFACLALVWEAEVEKRWAAPCTEP